MIRRILAATAAAILLTLAGIATPAHAATINWCESDNVCFYDSINNYPNDGFWQREFSYIRASWPPNSQSGCVNLNTHLWHNGGTVYDTPSSMILNRGGSSAQLVTVYDWVGCNGNGGFAQWIVGGGATVIELNLSNLTDCDNGLCSTNWYGGDGGTKKISSVRVQNY